MAFFIVVSLLLCIQIINAQEHQKIIFKPYGFVKFSAWYDSRQVDGNRDDLMLFYPLNRNIGAHGIDLNARHSLNFSAMNTRAGFRLSGPKAMGAEATALIEGDYTGAGSSMSNTFRLRHAYLNLKWDKTELLAGQYWHPMFVPEVFPDLYSLNTGAPFQPFIRSPQISFRYYSGKNRLELSLLSQRDNASDGPIGRSPVYLKNAVLPNIHLQWQHKNNQLVLGAAYDYKRILPQLVYANIYQQRETVEGHSFMAFLKTGTDNWNWRIKAIYGQNLTEHLLLGGYAVRIKQFDTNNIAYTPTNHLFLWSELCFETGQFHYGLFVGYARNFGTSHENNGKYYAKGSDIAQLMRMSPIFSYRSGPVKLAGELEYTRAYYGTPNNHGIIKQTNAIGNVRLTAAAIYTF